MEPIEVVALQPRLDAVLDHALHQIIMYTHQVGLARQPVGLQLLVIVRSDDCRGLGLGDERRNREDEMKRMRVSLHIAWSVTLHERCEKIFCMNPRAAVCEAPAV